MFPVPDIEKLSLDAPFGLCFHDAAAGERVIDGLSVSVYSAAQTNWRKRTEARPNRSVVFVLHKADGLGEFTRGAGDEEFLQNNPPQKSFLVEVVDRESRFQPFQFTLNLPVKGIYQWRNFSSASPGRNLSSIPLYSAPTRARLGAMSVIRAELRESLEKAASFAVLEACFNSSLIARGIADRDGQIVLMFPALSPQNNPFTSPPSDAARISIAEQKWNLDLTLKYELGIFRTSPPLPTAAEEEFFPDLRLVLAQATGSLRVNAAKTEILSTSVLQIGVDLILCSPTVHILSPTPPAETVFSTYLFVSPV